MIEGAGTTLISANNVYSGGTVYISRFTFDSASSSIHMNGVSVASGDAGTTDLDSRLNAFIGTVGASQFFDGKVGEMIVCTDGTLTAQQISDAETYLADKWGITL
jgi:hypothetical protein